VFGCSGVGGVHEYLMGGDSDSDALTRAWRVIFAAVVPRYTS
jgi:hypothetical protein